MRELKFRFFDTETNNWCVDGKEENSIYDFAFKQGMAWTYLTKAQAMDRIIVLQSTGLKDKNGIKIYEGDILKICNGSINGIGWLDKPYCVEYILNSGFNLPMYCWDKEGNDIMDSTHYCEVIGNRFKNPELINQ